MNLGDNIKLINKYSYVKFKINENSLEKVIINLHKKKINIYDINKVSSDTYYLIIKKEDYKKVNKLYNFIFISNLGISNFIFKLKKYYMFIIGLIISLIFVFILSNIIFKVEIISNDKDLVNRLTNSLDKYDISPYHLKRKYKELELIKNKILEEYKSEIEWLEINRVGTKYIVKLNPRILNSETKKYKYQHLVARKNANILSMDIKSGQIMKDKYSYVKKGDIIVSGYTYLNDEIKSTGVALGKVYGEVWYITKVKYPFNYYKKYKTGNKKEYLSIKIFNKEIDLFNFNPFNDKISIEDTILKNNILPIRIVKKIDEEVIINSSMNVVEEVKDHALKYSIDRINKTLKDNEYIINYKIISSSIIDSGVELYIFFSICEDITSYVEIEDVK